MSENEIFYFHKANYDKINEYFSNFKWKDLFQNRNANKCWLKFLEIAKEAIELYVSIRGQKKRKVPPWMTKKVLRIRKYKSVLWKKYHNSESYNDICEYKIILNKATSEYKIVKYSLKKKLANNVKTYPKSFYAYVRSKSKTKTSVGPLKNGDFDFG